MSIKKFLFFILAVLSVATALSICVFAVDPILSTEPGMGYENEIKFELDRHLTITTSETNNRKDRLPFLFDGDIADGGIYSNDNSWYGPEGDHLLILFSEPTEITKFAFYLTGNWSKATVEFFDADGNVILLVDDDERTVANDNAYGPQAAKKVVFKADTLDDVMIVSYIKIATYDNKWDKDYTFKVAEIEIWGFHEHDFSEPGEILKQRTCAEHGLAEMLCSCGDKEIVSTEPTGRHDIVDGEKVFFRDGFTNIGHKVSQYCTTCGTQDVWTDVEIGALFTSLGYSVREFGEDAGYAIQYGFGVNYDNLEYFKEVAGIEDGMLDYGIVATSKAVCYEGNPLKLDGERFTTSFNGVVCKSYTQEGVVGYDVYSYCISGFKSPDAEFYLSAYIFDGENIYYLSGETTTTSTAVSYAQFAEASEE